MLFTKKSSFIAYMILVGLALFGPAGIIATFGGSSTVKAEQPISVKSVYQSGGLTIYCEEPSDNKIYALSPQTGGAALVVVPGGCK